MTRLTVKVLDEPSFMGDTWALTLGGLATLVPHALILWAIGATTVGAVASAFAGALTLFAFVALRRGSRVKLLPGATSATLAGGSLALLMPVNPALAVVTFGGFFGLARATAYDAWSEKLGVVGWSAASALLASLAYVGIGPYLGGLPAAATSALGFASFGFLVGLGSFPAHMKLQPDRIGNEYRRLVAVLRSDIKDHAFRAHALSVRFDRTLTSEPFESEQQEFAFRDNLERLILRIFGLCLRWQEIETHITSFRISDVQGRVLMLTEKLKHTDDAVIRDRYERTKSTLEKREADYRELLQIKERLVSTLTLNFTHLEDIYFTLVKSQCALTGAATAEIEALTRNMADLTDEMTAATRSIEDLTAGVDLLPSAESVIDASGIEAAGIGLSTEDETSPPDRAG